MNGCHIWEWRLVQRTQKVGRRYQSGDIEHGVAEGQVRTDQYINSMRHLNMAYKRGRHPWSTFRSSLSWPNLCYTKFRKEEGPGGECRNLPRGCSVLRSKQQQQERQTQDLNNQGTTQHGSEEKASGNIRKVMSHCGNVEWQQPAASSARTENHTWSGKFQLHAGVKVPTSLWEKITKASGRVQGASNVFIMCPLRLKGSQSQNGKC